jgi:hypothetical protein
MRQAMREGIREVLDARFGVVPPAIAAALETIDNLEQLRQLQRQVATVETLDAFVRVLAAPDGA